MSTEHTVEETGPTHSRCMLNDWNGTCDDCPDKDDDNMICNQDD